MKELSTRWADIGHEVTVLTSAPDYPEGEVYDGYNNRIIRSEYIDGVKVISLKTIPASNSGFVRRGLKFVWFMIAATVAGLWLNRHDVVLSTSPQPLTGPAGWLIARLKGSRFVYEVRDLWPESVSSLSDIDQRILIPLRWAVNFTYRHTDRVVAVTPGFEPTLVESGVDPDDILIHYNGVSPSFFDHDGSEWSLDSELVESLQDTFVVSYVGTIGRAHGLAIVLDAAEMLEDVTFLLVGTGAEAETLRADAKRRNIDNIRFAGRHPKEHVPEFLALSDAALVHLRDEELFRSAVPSKMFEAMAAEVPVLLGVRGVAESILENSNAGIAFSPEDSESLVKAVERLRADEERQERLGENGLLAASEHFSWGQIAKEYSKDLQDLHSET
jgi:glycosyltransferase involved in cell wall biosynthesis